MCANGHLNRQVDAESFALLETALDADTAFLAEKGVMDYSLLVGVDKPQNVLVVGIIDFLRQVQTRPSTQPYPRSYSFFVFYSVGHWAGPTLLFGRAAPNGHSMRVRQHVAFTTGVMYRVVLDGLM